VVELLLNHRYGDLIIPPPNPMVSVDRDAAVVRSNEIIFLGVAADALYRRITRPDLFVAQQNIGPAAVRYTDRAGIWGWFLPEELAMLDDVTGRPSGAQTYRTIAPDFIRYGNRIRHENVS